VVEKAGALLDDEVYLVLGGFHLGSKSEREIAAIIADFRRLGVQRVAPCHCTGDRARAAFSQAYGEDYIAAGAGRVITVSQSAPSFVPITTPTPAPTSTPIETPTATSSPVPTLPPTDTPVPPTPTPAYQFLPRGPAQPELSQPCPGCPRAPGYIIGQVFDAEMKPLAGVRLVCYNEWHRYPVVGSKGDGLYDFPIIQARATWYVAVLDQEDRPISPESPVEFDPAVACWYRLDWQRTY
jgi:hypothetical protein